ncbi:hypothetical protein [Nonomuraea soli]|uniref:Vegetative cell wall protein gp1 n=1 Tax=Nonomuraea soli TaxID=1032476 RepID=A0A7W0HP49_9ACTN|nr:hypothetical protein [Nonomuraea soli]MBA2890498.1 hypothetical protein [Nonomuraea soli]
MTTLLGEVGKKLMDRWATLVVLPGLLFVASAVVGFRLGHAEALDVQALATWVGVRLAVTGAPETGGVLLAVVASSLAASGAGLCAAALGRVTAYLWTLSGERAPLRWLVRRRQARWRRANERVAEAIGAAVDAAVGAAGDRAVGAAGDRAVGAAGDRAGKGDRAGGGAGRGAAADAIGGAGADGVRAAMAARERVGIVEPSHPTWIGDRLTAPAVRVNARYGLDLDSAWPRLWLIVPDAVRAELTSANDAFMAAARLVGWMVLYAALGLVWWPSAAIAVVLAAAAWMQARAAVATLADLTEATVDLYGADLAEHLGIANQGRLDRDTGFAVTAALRKDDVPAPRPPSLAELRRK